MYLSKIFIKNFRGIKDLLVEFDKNHPIGLLKFAGIICDLEDLTGHKIDLVEEGTLKPFAVESVNRDKQLIYERA